MTTPHDLITIDNPNDLIQLGTWVERWQNEGLNMLATRRVSKQEHVMRAITMYLSRKDIMEALVALKQKPEALEDKQRSV